MNPIWVAVVHGTLKKLRKTCPHCRKQGTYEQKQQGQFYTCKYCGHRFKEKGQK